MRDDILSDLFATYIPPGSVEEQWEVSALEKALQSEFN